MVCILSLRLGYEGRDVESRPFCLLRGDVLRNLFLAENRCLFLFAIPLLAAAIEREAGVHQRLAGGFTRGAGKRHRRELRMPNDRLVGVAHMSLLLMRMRDC